MNAKILILDIETSPHLVWTWGLYNQNIAPSQVVIESGVISFAAKFYGDKHVYFASINDIGHDEMILLAHELISEADMVMGYNGDAFDLKHLNKEFLLMGLSEPDPYKTIDPLKTMRKKFKFASNKLDYILKQLGLGGKAENHGMRDWLAFMDGDPKVYERFKKYNITDVTKLEKLYKKILGWIPNHPNMTLYGEGSCVNCSSDRVHKRGYSTTLGGIYQKYQCQACGRYFRGTQRLGGATVTGT